jgi:ribosomal protein L28
MILKHVEEREPDYESRQNEILRFVRHNPNCTKADVIRHMLGRSALTTTHAILKDMIRDRKLNVYKKNLQTHLLTVNEKNEFNKIYISLSEIKSITDNLKHMVSTYKQDLNLTENYNEQFVIPLAALLNRFLQRLLVKTNDSIQSDKDLKILHKKITELMLKLAQFQYDEKYTIKQLTQEVKDLEEFINYYGSQEYRTILKKRLKGKPEPPHIKLRRESDTRLLGPMSSIMEKVKKISKEYK